MTYESYMERLGSKLHAPDTKVLQDRIDVLTANLELAQDALASEKARRKQLEEEIAHAKLKPQDEELLVVQAERDELRERFKQPHRDQQRRMGRIISKARMRRDSFAWRFLDDLLRKELEADRARKILRDHRTPEECVGCGCMVAPLEELATQARRVQEDLLARLTKAQRPKRGEPSEAWSFWS